MSNYYEKYLKYKAKYLELVDKRNQKYLALRNQIGGVCDECRRDNSSKECSFCSKKVVEDDAAAAASASTATTTAITAAAVESRLSIVTYNVYGKELPRGHIETRCPHIVAEIFKNGEPDVICLQEVTKYILDAIEQSHPQYFIWTKLQTPLVQALNEFDSDDAVEIDDLKYNGYMAILSKHPFEKPTLVSEGIKHNKGIMRVKNYPNGPDGPDGPDGPHGPSILVYNVHLNGGTFGKSEAVVEQKRCTRIEELKILAKSIREELGNQHGAKNIIVAGDFNYDSNDPEHYPEGVESPEHKVAGFVDLWTVMKPGEIGATEDENINTFRAAMKIKPDSEKRVSRYDKIVCMLTDYAPNQIEIIGNTPIPGEVVIAGKDVEGTRHITTTTLFPSDHFGLYVNFVKKKFLSNISRL